MQSALAGQAEKTRLLFAHARFQRAAGMSVTDRLKPMFPQRVVGQVDQDALP